MDLISMTFLIMMNLSVYDTTHTFVCDDNDKSCQESNSKKTNFVCGDHNHPCDENSKNNESKEK